MDYLLSTLKWSAVVGAAALALRLFKPLLDRRYRPRWRYWVWLALAAALLLAPVRWERLLPAAEAVTPPVIVEVPRRAVQVSRSGGVAVVDQPDHALPEPAAAAPEPGGEAAIPAAAPAGGVTVPAETVLTALWLAGITCFALYHIIGTAWFARRARRWGRAPSGETAAAYEAVCREMGLRRHPPLLISAAARSPMVTGLLRPRLLLPEEGYGPQELGFILRHELTHYRRRDLWYKLALLAANAVHWFNPLAYLLRREAGADLELTCDEAVVAGADRETRRAYSETLLMSLHRQRGLGQAVLSTHFYGGAAVMKQRLRNILGRQGRKWGALALVLALVLTGAAACSFGLRQAQDGSGQLLTEEELAQWQEKLSSRELNGFVTRLYTDVRYLPLGELFYNYMDEQADGTILSHVPENADTIYEAVFGFVPDCDYTGVTRSLADEFLLEHTGYTVEDFRGGFGSLWLCGEDSDSWFFAHGDTNYCAVNVLSGARAGDTVTLELELPGGSMSGGITSGTMTIVDGKIRSFTNPLYSAVEAMAWYVVDTAAENVETNAWTKPPEGETVPGGPEILDSYISGLWCYSSYEIGGRTWSVWELAYRLKPDDVSKVPLAGGMSEENGWLTESSSMGSPVLIVSMDGEGAVSLEAATYTGVMEEDSWTWEEYIYCGLHLGMELSYRLGGWPEISTPFILDLQNGHNTWAMDWQDTARSYLVQAGYQDAGELSITREFSHSPNDPDCDQSMLVETECGGETITLFMSRVTYNGLSFWQVSGVLAGDGANGAAGSEEDFYQKLDFTLAPGKTADLYLYGKKSPDGCGISKVEVIWKEDPGSVTFYTRDAIVDQWGEDSKDYYTECWDETGGLLLEDFNFDGYTDIGLQAWISASNLPRYLWLYDPESGKFQYALCVNGELTLDPEARTLTAANVDQAGAVQYQEHYQPDEAGMLYLARRDTLRYENGQYVPQSSEIYDREGNVTASGDGKLSVRAAYRQELEDVLEDWKTAFPDEDLSKNRFAIFDVDGDGQEELVLEHASAAIMAGLNTEVSGYVDGELVTELSEFPDLTFYGNGTVTAGWSHNQGMAGDNFWPYTLYRYNAAADTYVRVAMVDAWDKILRDKDGDGNPFPDDVDKDGDGMVYYIMTGGMYERKDPVDGADHQAWLDSYTGGALPMEIPYQALTAENVAALG